MLIHKLRSIALTLLLLGAVAESAGYLTHALAMKDDPKRPPAAPQPQIAAKPDDTAPAPAPGRMFVVGRVLDPQGKPVPGASVMVYARLKQSERPVLYQWSGPSTIQEARCDGSGRFRLDAPRTSSSRHEVLGVSAMAPSYGIGWVEIDPDADKPSADITLRSEQVIRGRLFDVQGRPAQGVVVTVSIITHPVNGRLEVLRFRRFATDAPPAWPNPATTDAEGRFTLRGLGQQLSALLCVDDLRFASQITRIETEGALDSEFGSRIPAVKVDTGPDSKPLTMALQPAQIITGRVTYADTGKPVPHAPIAVSSMTIGRGGSFSADFQTDGEGRFRINPLSGDRFNLTTQSPDGEPYLSVSKRLDWPKGAVLQSVDLALTRGVLIRGKVTEEGSGRPVVGAVLRFTPNSSPRNSQGWNSPTASTTGPDGSFRVAASPGPGFLVIQGPSDDFVLRERGAEGGVFSARPSRRRLYAHAYRFLDLKPESTDQEVNIAMRRGATVKCRVIGPDDQPIRDAWVFSRVILDAVPTGGWRTWHDHQDTGGDRGHVRDGRFELHGLDSDTEVPVYFLDAKHELGVTVRLSGKSAASGAVTIQLAPCGTARARFVDPGGKPLEGYRRPPSITMIVIPGPPSRGPAQEKVGRLSADEGYLFRIDPAHYGTQTMSDAQGRMVFPALIPGATYHIIDTTARDETGPKVRKDFSVKPGETVDLGEIRIEKPPAS